MNLNKITLAAIIMIIAMSASAAEPKNTKSQAKMPAVTAEAPVAKVVEAPVKATGPVSFGKIKLGMTKAEIEALTAQDNYYLVIPMSPYVHPKESTDEPEADKSKYKGRLVTPFNGAEPLVATFTFKNDSLVYLSIDLENRDSLFDDLKEMVTNKYGQPVIEGKMRVEQCRYRNGANFPEENGVVSEYWTAAVPDSTTEFIITSFLNIKLESCPTSLKDNMIKINIKSMDMRRGKKVEPKPEAF